MSSTIPLTSRAIHRVILESFDRLSIVASKEPLHIETVAAELHCSRSTLQRRLAELGTTYTIELHHVQSVVAVNALLHGDGPGNDPRKPTTSIGATRSSTPRNSPVSVFTTAA